MAARPPASRDLTVPVASRSSLATSSTGQADQVVQDDHLALPERQGGQGVAQVDQVRAELRDQRRRAKAQQCPGR
jgi:hypothetical protein